MKAAALSLSSYWRCLQVSLTHDSCHIPAWTNQRTDTPPPPRPASMAFSGLADWASALHGVSSIRKASSNAHPNLVLRCRSLVVTRR